LLTPIIGVVYFFTGWISNELMIFLILLNPLYFIAFLDTSGAVISRQNINDMHFYKMQKEYLSEILLLKKEVEKLQAKIKD